MEHNTQLSALDKVWSEFIAQCNVRNEQRMELRIEQRIQHILTQMEKRIMTVEELTARLEADASAYTSDLETVKTLTESNTAEISTLRTELADIKVTGDTTRAEAALAIIEGNNTGLSALGTPAAPAPPVA